MLRLSRQKNIQNGVISASNKVFDGEFYTHWHDFYEFEYFTRGSGDYIIDGVRYEIAPGMLFFMTPLNFHSVRAQDCQLHNVMFSEKICNLDFLSRLLNGSTPCAMQIEEKDRPFFAELLEELSHASGDEAFASCLLNGILGKIARNGARKEENFSPVNRATLFILNHFRDNPSLSEVAAYAGFTPTYFSELFKRETGLTFKEYVDRLRFDYAKKLIDYSKLSVGQICRESGFDDYANFIRRFKERFGISPGKMMQARKS
ncbi:MAG: helix-turn-helix domain-containing protein [Clostridia bacterium]|nr:helix-turn-helix domain-containing protein [Clostridia bacterium]